ncbi:hypothetical protein M0813_17543 [Anaeramoeba flamelloides]|uniref:SnoaL-like domain-containing protein n=1 Tax=Anaeramoeba flamelloides TaxID=1746091 RepID=A0AAV7YXW8_9EUKA|nr:hypothetical protein M0812_22650 [Anaeramoeba flamelloides]KAJ6248574.1 hypothetical protein M0813_17543 [Anaeramoeba flamelloides]
MEKKLQLLLDEREIIVQVNNIGVYADSCEWEKLKTCFTEKVIVDYTSMSGGEPETLSPNQICKNWSGFLPGFKMTQHMITNHKVDINGDEAECNSYVQATHYLPNEEGEDTWLILGSYKHFLVRKDGEWKVKHMIFTLKLSDGNTNLPKLALKALQEKK